LLGIKNACKTFNLAQKAATLSVQTHKHKYKHMYGHEQSDCLTHTYIHTFPDTNTDILKDTDSPTVPRQEL